VNVYVNDQDIRHREGLDTEVGANNVVILLPAMAGGCRPRLDSAATVRTMRPAFELKHKSKLQRSCREARA